MAEAVIVTMIPTIQLDNESVWVRTYTPLHATRRFGGNVLGLRLSQFDM